MGSETGRAKRYAQYGFEGMSALERFMLLYIDCVFCNFAKKKSNDINIQQTTNHVRFVSKLNP